MSVKNCALSRRSLVGGTLALSALSAPFIRAKAATPIRIGFPIPLTGPYQEEALDMLRGAHVGVAQFNMAGGLNGQTAELLTRDDELDPGRAAEVTRDLIQKDNANFITGGLSASVQLAINQITKSAKVVFNSISESDRIVALPDWSPYTFHEAPTPHMTAQSVGKYVFNRYVRRVAFLAADYAFGNELVNGFQEAGAPLGVQVVATVRHPLGTIDFRPYLEEIAAAKPNVLLLCNFGADQRNAIQQATWMQLKNSMKLIAPVIDFTARLELGAEPYNDILGGAAYYWLLEDKIPSARAFNDAFRAMNDGLVPSSYGALGYAGVMTLLTAAKHANSSQSDKVAQVLEGMKYDLYKGPQYYRPCDHQSVQSMLILNSRFTTDPNDMNVFDIVQVDPPDEAMLATCAAEGHS